MKNVKIGTYNYKLENITLIVVLESSKSKNLTLARFTEVYLYEL